MSLCKGHTRGKACRYYRVYIYCILEVFMAQIFRQSLERMPMQNFSFVAKRKTCDYTPKYHTTGTVTVPEKQALHENAFSRIIADRVRDSNPRPF